MTDVREEKLALIRELLERAKAQYEAELERELFGPHVCESWHPTSPPSRQERFNWWLQRCKHYILTLGLALRGVALVREDDYE